MSDLDEHERLLAELAVEREARARAEQRADDAARALADADERVKRRIERERRARKEAERLAEAKTLALYQANLGLERAVGDATSELRDTLRHLSAIIENLTEGLLVTGPDGAITHHNPMLASLFEVPTEELSGTSVDARFGPAIAALVADATARPSETFTADVELPGRRHGRASSSGIVAAAGHAPLGVVVLVRDVTREREVDRMKTDFISTVSHELRTPLTSVLGFAKIIGKRLDELVFPLVEAHPDRKVRRAVELVRGNVGIIISEGERLTALINDVLDIAKMEAGQIDWNMEPVDLGALMERSVAALSVLLKASELELVMDIEPDLPPVLGDRARLMQVLINLLSNAAKFTKQGSITCRVRRRGDALEVSIVDTGIGIPLADQARVFERFQQVGNTLSDKPQGTGLGLPICRQIVEHHGGRIWLESVPGRGSSFSLSLPLAAAEPAGVRTVEIGALVRRLQAQVDNALTAPATRQKTILVVDDEANIRELLRQELESEGHIVCEAADGLAAIGMVKERRPDLVILDIMMPKINGFDVAAILKNDPETMDLPIIVLSIVNDEARGLRLGIDRYLSKPLDREQLLTQVGGLLQRGTSKKQILVVDEDVSTVTTLARVLEARGYGVTEAFSGEELVEKAKTLKPDMIIVSSVLGEPQRLVHSLRFERGLENVFILLYG